jgi:hypothetical protein
MITYLLHSNAEYRTQKPLSINQSHYLNHLISSISSINTSRTVYQDASFRIDRL